MRKFADTQPRIKQAFQTLRPLYPLWILEGAGQYLLKMSMGLLVVEISSVDRNGDRHTGARIKMRLNYITE